MAKRKRNPEEFTYRKVKYHVTNPDDWMDGINSDRGGLFEFQFGHGGIDTPTFVLVWGSYFESAMEEAVDWLSDNAPEYLTDFDEARKHTVSELESMGHDHEDEGLVDAWMSDTYIYTERGYLTHGNWHGAEVKHKPLIRKALVESVRNYPEALEDEYDAEVYRKALARLKNPRRKKNPAGKKRKSSKSVSSLISKALK